uniref:POLG alternative reading frame-like n=1 Tax=Panthera onca TaxID=9690 RepID=UPI002955416C|nr:POLG alternative reading frame-like [Panthera onca]
MWGGGDIAIATGGWAASRAAAGRVRAGPDIRRGAAAALDGAARATGGPAGTVPRRPRARPRRAPAPSASPRGPAGAARTQPGGAAAQSCGRPRARSRCRSRRWGHRARHLCLRRPPEKFVVRSRMAPLDCGSGAGKRLAVVMAPPLPAAAAPRGRSARRTPPPPPARAPGASPSAEKQTKAPSTPRKARGLDPLHCAHAGLRRGHGGGPPGLGCHLLPPPHLPRQAAGQAVGTRGPPGPGRHGRLPGRGSVHPLDTQIS